MDENTVKRLKLRNSFDPQGYYKYIKANHSYTKLVEYLPTEKFTWMSDTPMELFTNQQFLDKANGDVLIFGLGMGLIIAPLANDPAIKSITVIEQNKNVIDLIKPFYNHPKITILQGDAYNYEFSKEIMFDTIYFDIWPSRCMDNYKDMKILHKKYRKHLNKNNLNKYMSSWLYDWCKQETYKENKYNKLFQPTKYFSSDIINQLQTLGGDIKV